MRGLAEYAMSGRFQAATTAILFGLLPGFSIVSGAVVALVTLRRGLRDGSQVLLWAVLPGLLQWQLGDASMLFMLLGSLLAGGVLRQTHAWQPTAVLVTLYGVLLQSSLPWQVDFLERVRTAVTGLIDQGVMVQLVQEGEVVPATPELLMQALLRYYGGYQMLMLLGCLMLGRYWQALLYNPGGFREEFHNLRFDRRVMALLLLLIMAGLYGGPPFSEWLMILCVMPLLNGLAVVHKALALRAGSRGTGFLVLAYLLLFVAAPAYVVLGFADSAFDFRKRLSAT